MTGEAGLTGGAERAAHGAAGLTGDADRHAVLVAHQDGLDRRAVAQAKDPLPRRAEVALHVVGDLDARGEELGESRAQDLGDRRDLVDALRLDPEPVPDLIDPVARLPSQQCRQLFLGVRRRPRAWCNATCSSVGCSRPRRRGLESLLDFVTAVPAHEHQEQQWNSTTHPPSSPVAHPDSARPPPARSARAASRWSSPTSTTNSGDRSPRRSAARTSTATSRTPSRSSRRSTQPSRWHHCGAPSTVRASAGRREPSARTASTPRRTTSSCIARSSRST